MAKINNKLLNKLLCVFFAVSTGSASMASSPSFKDQTQSYAKELPKPQVTPVWSHSQEQWQVVRHQNSSRKIYYAANNSSTDAYMTLSVLFTPSKHCEDEKSFIAIKLSKPAPFSARKKGVITTRFDEGENSSITTDYIFTKGSHIIWVDMPQVFIADVKRFGVLHIRVDDYIQGQPARQLSLSGSLQSLRKAQNFCYGLMRSQ